MDYNDLMVDIETMSTKSNAALVSIGACMFNLKENVIGPKKYIVVDHYNCFEHGLDQNMDTMQWWSRQSPEAQAVFSDPNKVELPEALQALTQFIVDNKGFGQVQAWGNGATFDNVILQNAYDAVKLERPWAFWADRDVRTLVQLGKDLHNFNPKSDMLFEGVAHNAADDAVHQAKYCNVIYQRLIGGNYEYTKRPDLTVI